MENNSPQSSTGFKFTPLIGIIGIAIVLIVAAVAFSLNQKPSTTTDNSSTPTQQEAIQETPTEDKAMDSEQVKTIEIDGSNFKFTPNTITVNQGDTVKIVFKNSQGFHDFTLDEFDVKTKTIQANETDEVTFTADKKGAFQFYCSVGNHRAMGMVGTITVN